MVDDGFEHAVFGIFEHRLQPVDIGFEAGIQFAINRFICRSFHTALHVSVKSVLRLFNAFFSFLDVHFHVIHFGNTARRTSMDHVDSRSS